MKPAYVLVTLVFVADLVLLDADTLDNISNTANIAGVLVHHHWLSKNDSERRLGGGP